MITIFFNVQMYFFNFFYILYFIFLNRISFVPRIMLILYKKNSYLDPVIILIKVASICANKNPQLNWNFHSNLFISNARNTRAAARLRVSCGVRVHIAHAAISGDYGCVLGAMRLCHGRS